MPRRQPKGDHGARMADRAARNRKAEWRAFHGALAGRIDQMRATPENFYMLRRIVLNLNRAQAGRLLRVDKDSILNWETGARRLPFPAFLALHLLNESLAYRFASTAWADWHIVQRFDAPRRNVGLPGMVTELTNAKIGAAFEPEDLEAFHQAMQAAVGLREQNAELRAKVDALMAENTEIRELFRVGGVTDELHAMQERVDSLLGKINVAAVIPLRKKQAA